MSIIINVVEESPGRNTVDQLEEEHGKVCNQVDVLGGELCLIDGLMEHLNGYDPSVTEDELRYHELLDSSLAKRLNSLKGDMGVLLRYLAVVRNDIETRFSGCKDKSIELEKKIQESIDQENQEEEEVLSDRSRILWNFQERDNIWSTESKIWNI